MSKEAIRVLLVEDNPGDACLLRELIQQGDASQFDLMHVARFSEALQSLGTSDLDVVLLDLGLPDSGGLDTLRQTQAVMPGVPIEADQRQLWPLRGQSGASRDRQRAAE